MLIHVPFGTLWMLSLVHVAVSVVAVTVIPCRKLYVPPAWRCATPVGVADQYISESVGISDAILFPPETPHATPNAYGTRTLTLSGAAAIRPPSDTMRNSTDVTFCAARAVWRAAIIACCRLTKRESLRRIRVSAVATIAVSVMAINNSSSVNPRAVIRTRKGMRIVSLCAQPRSYLATVEGHRSVRW